MLQGLWTDGGDTGLQKVQKAWWHLPELDRGSVVELRGVRSKPIGAGRARTELGAPGSWAALHLPG